jgi:hypothetical protein
LRSFRAFFSLWPSVMAALQCALLTAASEATAATACWCLYSVASLPLASLSCILATSLSAGPRQRGRRDLLLYSTVLPITNTACTHQSFLFLVQNGNRTVDRSLCSPRRSLRSNGVAHNVS